MTASMFQLGPIVLSVDGGGPVFDEIVRELGVLEDADRTDGGADVVLRFVDEFACPDEALHVGRWRLADHTVLGGGHGYDFRIDRDDGAYIVEITTDDNRRRLTDHLERSWDWNFLASWETTAKNIMYDLFDVVTAAAILKQGASYLHASTCARDGAAAAMIGWGGIGKTTSILKLITEDGWRFLSDDLGLVDTDRRVWRTPRRLQVYAYNVAGQPELTDRLLSGRGPVDRLNWYWRRMRFGPKRVRRRIDAEELFGSDAVASFAPLEKAIFLQRADTPKMQWEPIDSEVLAKRAAAILVDELDPLFEVAVAAESHDIDVGVPCAEDLLSTSRAILEEAFDGVDTEQLTIPLDAGPDALADALRPHLPS